MRSTHVLLYVPNLLCYARILLAIYGLHVLKTEQLQPKPTTVETQPFMEKYWLYLIVVISAIFTDLLDGYFARLLDQCSTFGIFLDVVADNILRTTLWIGAIVVDPKYLVPGTFIVCLEWSTFVCTQLTAIKKRNGHWKHRGSSVPWIVQKFFENGFKNPLGASGVISLFFTPLYIFMKKTDGFQAVFGGTIKLGKETFDYIGLYLFIFRAFCGCIEIYFISEYATSLVNEHDDKRDKRS